MTTTLLIEILKIKMDSFFMVTGIIYILVFRNYIPIKGMHMGYTKMSVHFFK